MLKNLARILVKILVLPISVIFLFMTFLIIAIEMFGLWLFDKKYSDWDREYNRKAIHTILWWLKVWNGKLP